jgi:exonuclease III
LQGTQRKTQASVETYRTGTHLIYEWGFTPASGKAAGVIIALRAKLFQPDHVVRVYTPPAEFQGRAAALRLKRGDVDFLVVNVYVPINPRTHDERTYIQRLWAWTDNLLSQMPHRCVPLIFTDANARVGKGPASDSIGTCQPVTENHNGKALRELLTKHCFSAINTFHDAGDTYFGQFGNNSRIDYICLPTSMAGRVLRCQVLYAAGKRLQLIPSAGKRDHMPLQIVFKHKHTFHHSPSNFTWDRPGLARGVLAGYKRQDFLSLCEAKLRDYSLEDHQEQPPDDVWRIINTCVQEAGQQVYARPHKHTLAPTDTQQAHEDMVVQRSHLVSLPRPQRLSQVVRGVFSLDEISAIFRQWRALAKFWKARRHFDFLAKRDKIQAASALVHDFEEFWHSRDGANMWATARLLSGKPLGPNKRVYNKPVSVRPSADEWDEYLRRAGKDGGWLADRTENCETSFRIEQRCEAWEVERLRRLTLTNSCFACTSASYGSHVLPGLPQQKFGDSLLAQLIIEPNCAAAWDTMLLHKAHLFCRPGCNVCFFTYGCGAEFLTNGITAADFNLTKTTENLDAQRFELSVAWIQWGAPISLVYGKNVPHEALVTMHPGIAKTNRGWTLCVSNMLWQQDSAKPKCHMSKVF